MVTQSSEASRRTISVTGFMALVFRGQLRMGGASRAQEREGGTGEGRTTGREEEGKERKKD